jgi:hypothetical protein
MKILRAQFGYAVKLGGKTITSFKPGDDIIGTLQDSFIILQDLEGNHSVTTLYNLQWMKMEDLNKFLLPPKKPAYSNRKRL